jgi:hypothetical protein
MTRQDSNNSHAQLLEKQGNYVVNVEGVDWYDHGGFMIPAYLPHCCPQITPAMAREVVDISNRPFARWDTKYRQLKRSQWWWVVRRGCWSLDQCSSSTRSKIRRGRKNFKARLVSPSEMLTQGYDVCERSVRRYEKNIFLPSKEEFEVRVRTAPGSTGGFEFFGVFSGRQLVGFSENYLQEGGIFWKQIWYDPEFLSGYSSYVLIDTMLDYYLNQEQSKYVLDGHRNIFHKTQIQDFLIQKFGFTREYALLNVLYSARFRIAVELAYPFKKIFHAFSARWHNEILDKVEAILHQEHIRRYCLNL